MSNNSLPPEESVLIRPVMSRPRGPRSESTSTDLAAAARQSSSRRPQFLASNHNNNNNNDPPPPPPPPPQRLGFKDDDKGYEIAAMYPASAGHQLDLNHLWQQVQQLSEVLARNRESTEGLVKKADEIRSRGGEPGFEDAAAPVNGDVPTGGSSQRELELADENKELKQEVSELRVENDELVLLAQRHEEVLEKVLDGLRKYANEHSIATINIHSSYTNQLASERTQNAALRQREMDNSARLTKLSGLLREAYQQETVLEPDIVIEQLKAENEALRQALGVEDLEGEGEGEGGI